jgi:hypothetical protein
MATQITNCSGTASNPLSELGSNVGDNSIPNMQTQTGLPQIALSVLYNNGAGKNLNQYAGYLYILIHGWGALDKSFSYHTVFAPYVVTKETYNDFIDKSAGILYNCGLLDLCKRTCPAGKNGQLNDLGRLGLFSRLTGFQVTNPITGPAIQLPPSSKDTLDVQHSGFVDGLQSFCESINTHAYLKCFAVGSYGGFQEAIHSITNTVHDFYDAMFDLYQDMQLLMIQAQMMIQQYIADLQFFLTNRFLQGKIGLFLSLICLVLSTVQTVIDDVAFFGSLFDGSDNLFAVLNSVQTVVNFGAQAIEYIYNPITAGLPALFPKEAKQLVDFVNKLGDVPSNYLGILLKHFSFGKAMHNKGIAIANTIIQHYGLGSQLGDLNPMLQSFGCVVPSGNWHRTNPPVIKGPITFKPPKVPYNLRTRVQVDPYSLSSIWQMVKKDFSNLTTDGGVLEKDLSLIRNQLTKQFDGTANNITG